MFEKLKEWAQRLKRDTYALYYASQDPRVPWYVKLLAAFVVAQALSPLDLIPDFIPVLGYLDDLIIIPLGLLIAVRLIPEEVMIEAREKAASKLIEGKFISRAGSIIVVSIWLAVLMAGIVLGLKLLAD